MLIGKHRIIITPEGGSYDDTFLREESYLGNVRHYYECPITSELFWPAELTRYYVGSGANAAIGIDSSNQPVMRLMTSASTNREAIVGAYTIAGWIPNRMGGYKISRNPEMIISVKMETVLPSTGAYFGFLCYDHYGGAQTDFAVLFCNGTNWTLYNSQHTTGGNHIDTGIPVDTNWINFKLKLSTVQSELYRSSGPTDFEDWTLVATNTTNLPLASRLLCGYLSARNWGVASDLRATCRKLVFSQDWV